MKGDDEHDDDQPEDARALLARMYAEVNDEHPSLPVGLRQDLAIIRTLDDACDSFDTYEKRDLWIRLMGTYMLRVQRGMSPLLADDHPLQAVNTIDAMLAASPNSWLAPFEAAAAEDQEDEDEDEDES